MGNIYKELSESWKLYAQDASFKLMVRMKCEEVNIEIDLCVWMLENRNKEDFFIFTHMRNKKDSLERSDENLLLDWQQQQQQHQNKNEAGKRLHYWYE